MLRILAVGPIPDAAGPLSVSPFWDDVLGNMRSWMGSGEMEVRMMVRGQFLLWGSVVHLIFFLLHGLCPWSACTGVVVQRRAGIKMRGDVLEAAWHFSSLRKV